MTQRTKAQKLAGYGYACGPLGPNSGPYPPIITAADRRRLEMRRRIDDILLAAQLEREALDEVWDHA